jgi:hypothetical protein
VILLRWKLSFVLALAIDPSVIAAPVPGGPAPRGPAEYGQSVQSRDNLKKLGLAFHNYHDMRDHFPKDITDKSGRPVLSWRVAILPYLDQEYLYSQFKLDEPWDSEHNRRLLPHMPAVLRAPVQARKAFDTYYQAVAGPGAIFDPGAAVKLLDVADGTSNTLLLVEAGTPVPWAKPADIPFNPAKRPLALEGPYTDAIHVVCGDGSTHRMKPKPDADLLTAFITRDGGEIIEENSLWAAPAKPVNDREKKLLAEKREWAKRLLREAAGQADDRFRVEQALRKLNAMPRPDPAAIETFEELDELIERAHEQRWADWKVYDQLIEVLKEKALKTAEQIEKDHQDRRIKEEAERAKK